MTFSIVAHCPRTGQLGVAVSTAVPAVGAMCPFSRARVGAVSTQSWVNPYLATRALDLIASGLDAPTALECVLQSDQAKQLRQIGIVDSQGRAAVWSGTDCTSWAGDIVGPGYSIQGNMLVSGETLTAMQTAFVEACALELAERLMRALEAGQHAGGDKRGRQSASLSVYENEDYPLWDLRVDEHSEPVAELRRVFNVAALQLIPFVRGMPTRNGAGAPAPEHVVEMLALSPALRPGGSLNPALRPGDSDGNR